MRRLIASALVLLGAAGALSASARQGAELMARWPTEGACGEDLLAEFYARVKAGESPARALRAAQATLRSREDTRAPYCWAGWIVIGG